MAEVLVHFTEPVKGTGGALYTAQACGGVASDGLWEAWIEFIGPSGSAVRTPRETEQPNRNDLVYWAEGLTTAYLEGALRRALDEPVPVASAPETKASLFPEPRPATVPVPPLRQHSVLDPFATYAQGEGVLRRQLLALSPDHLTALVDAYGLDVGVEAPLTKVELAERIIRSVKRSVSAA